MYVYVWSLDIKLTIRIFKRPSKFAIIEFAQYKTKLNAGEACCSLSAF